MTQSTKYEFDNSLEATEFMEKLQEMLDDSRLKKWTEVTDCNFGTQTADSLWLVRLAYEGFINSMRKAA